MSLEILEAHFARMDRRAFTVPGITTPEGKPWVIHIDPVTPAFASAFEMRTKGKGDADMAVFATMLGAKNQDGEPIFEDTAATVAALQKMPLKPLQAIAREVLSYTGGDDLGN